MDIILEKPCDHAGCTRVGPVTQIPIKQGGAVYLCVACLAVAQGSHNLVEKESKDDE